MDKIRLALDWTPNVNHVGFFIAQEKGFYKELGIEVEIQNPLEDNYKYTPAKKVELDIADVALCPTESLISYQTKSKPFDLTAIAAVLQDDLSAIVVRKDADIQSPKDLDDKIYASYNAKYEDGIIQEMIKNDGGKGIINISNPDKLGIWNTLIRGKADATWIFLNWEGVQAKNFDVEFNYFTMEDYGIPYSYSPVIAVSLQKAKLNNELYKNFLEATKKGYLFCKNNPKEAVRILGSYIPKEDKNIDLNEALHVSLPSFGNEENWGIIEEHVISEFLNWIESKELEKANIQVENIFSNKFLEK